VLPKVTHPVNKAKIDSTGQEIYIRNMLGKEEKILLIAKQSGLDEDILIAILQCVQNCIETPDIDISQYPISDVEDLFIQIRANSMGDKIMVPYVFDAGKENQRIINFEVDLKKVKVFHPPKVDPNIKLPGDIVLSMRFPRAYLYKDETLLDDDIIGTYKTIVNCIDKIWYGTGDDTKMVDPRDIAEPEMFEWLETIPLESWSDLRAFINSIPSLQYDIKFGNGDGDVIRLTTLKDFFTFS
jgi:hypothetical protein